MNITAKMPTDHCDECGQMKPAFGLTHLTSEAGGVGRKLCSECCNREYMLRAGLPELETVDFEPLSCRDCAGKKHIFHFVVHMSTGLGIKAFELVDGAPGGYQFFVLEPPQTAVREAHDKLVKKIEAGLSVRYLRSSDFPGSGAREPTLCERHRRERSNRRERRWVAGRGSRRPTVQLGGIRSVPDTFLRIQFPA